MRISALESDPGYWEWLGLGERRYQIEVFVDGDLVRYPVTADDEKGLVYVYAKDLSGSFIMADDQPVLRCIEGRVRIVVGVSA